MMPAMFSIASWSVALNAAVHVAASTQGDATCRDDASMLQVQTTGQLKEQAAMGPHPGPPDVDGETETNICTLDKEYCSWTEVDGGNTQRDNEVWFAHTSITNFETDNDGCKICVSEGQPWNGMLSFAQDQYPPPDGRGTYDGTTITVKAGRKKSAPCAHSFLNWEGKPELGCGNAFGINTEKCTPDMLNFVIKGTLRFSALAHNGFPARSNVRCPYIRIGQTKDGSRNNWWVGCSDGQTDSLWGLSCPCSDDTGPVLVSFNTYMPGFKAENYKFIVIVRDV